MVAIMDIAIWDQDEKRWHSALVNHAVFSDWFLMGAILRAANDNKALKAIPPTHEEFEEAYLFASNYQKEGSN